MKETFLATPVFNNENLRGGQFVRFFIERSTTYPSRCSDSLTSPSVFSGDPIGNLPGFRVPSRKSSLKERKRLASILNAEVAAFVLVWPACQYDLQANYANRTALQPLIDLVRWTVSAYMSNGEAFVAKRLKLFMAWARYKAGPQLHAAPERLSRFPFCDAEGVPDFGKFLTGSISSCASSSVSLMRLSRMSRAFPPGDKVTADKAVADHKSLMTSRYETKPPILRLFGNVVSKVSKDSLDGVERPGVTLSSSACWERTRARGGAAEELAYVMDRHYPAAYYTAYMPGDPVDEYIANCRGQSQTDDGEFLLAVEPIGLPHEVEPVETMAWRACVEERFPSGDYRELAKHRVLPVPDRGGFKTRVITAGEAIPQSLAQNVRKIIYRHVLPKTPSRWSLIEDGVRKFLSQAARPDNYQDLKLGEWVSLSCDMKSATDRFPHDVVQAINDSLESNIAEEHRRCVNWLAWKSLSGPQQLRYPGEKDDDPLTITTCGNLMGTAPSWVHLNLLNLVLIRTAWSLWSDVRCRKTLSPFINGGKCCNIQSLDKSVILSKVEEIVSRPQFNCFRFPSGWRFNNMTCIVGDDLGAVCPFAVAVLYEVLLESVNGLTSFGKHYVQPWQDGAFMLIAEEVGVVTGDKLTYQRCETLRGIVAATHQYDSRDPMPAWHQIGSVLSSSIERVRPDARRAMCSLGHIALSDWRSTLLKMGLPVYLPRSVGGLGWPHPRGESYALERVSTRALMAYQVLRGFRSDPIAFAFQILKLRSSWLSTERNPSYTELLQVLKSYFVGFKVSRDANGALKSLTADATIGLKPDDESSWSVVAAFQNGECMPLVDAIDQLVLQGLNVGYLCGAKNPVFEKPYLEAKRAGKRYSACVSKLLSLRQGHVTPISQRSEYARLIKEDEELLKSLYIWIDESFIATFPYLSRPISDGI
uniref:RNA-dependent RNA polymerase n=1 Tax=Meagle narna-like virus TaxID=2716648 RepID=A0A6G7PRY1_9VIRU|nr:RNA-dependent RNA polymerase [Meagle narna-like virus]